MRPLLSLAAGVAALLLISGAAPAPRPVTTTTLDNPAIDMDAYLRVAKEAAAHRESRRVSEAEFLRMSRESGTVVLDARSARMYDQFHVKGAINLSFPDIAVESLKQTLPDKGTRILIYCNNNFFNAELVLPRKIMEASLNLSTYISLYSYGYRNVYELAPLEDIHASQLEFEGSQKDAILGMSADRAKLRERGRQP